MVRGVSRQKNIVERFQCWAEDSPQQLAVRFLKDGEKSESTYSYAQILDYAQSVGGFYNLVLNPGIVCCYSFQAVPNISTLF